MSTNKELAKNYIMLIEGINASYDEFKQRTSIIIQDKKKYIDYLTDEDVRIKLKSLAQNAHKQYLENEKKTPEEQKTDKIQLYVDEMFSLTPEGKTFKKKTNPGPSYVPEEETPKEKAKELLADLKSKETEKQIEEAELNYHAEKRMAEAIRSLKHTQEIQGMLVEQLADILITISNNKKYIDKIINKIIQPTVAVFGIDYDKLLEDTNDNRNHQAGLEHKNLIRPMQELLFTQEKIANRVEQLHNQLAFDPTNPEKVVLSSDLDKIEEPTDEEIKQAQSDNPELDNPVV
jgi:hypothetical protein